MKEISKKKIQEVEEKIQHLLVCPQTFTYVKLYQALLELHFFANMKQLFPYVIFCWKELTNFVCLQVLDDI